MARKTKAQLQGEIAMLTAANAELCEQLAGPARRRTLPDTRPSKTHKFKIESPQGPITCHLIVGLFEDGSPGEVFLNIGKQGSTLNGLVDTIGILVSYALQYGVPLGDLSGKLRGHNFEPQGPTYNPEIPECSSIVDYVFSWLEREYLGPPAIVPGSTPEEEAK